MNEQSTPQILVIADDITGGNDAGVSFVRAGLQVDVAFELPWRGNADVLIVNCDSRAQNAQEAAARVSDTVHACLSDMQPLLLKKIDSTLRGNAGAELNALMQASGKRLAIVAPAFPGAGRTTVGGQCLVHGVPVTQTEFTSDPKTPVVSADICALLQAQTTIPCRSLSSEDFSQRLSTWCNATAEIWVVDARTDADLDDIVNQILTLPEQPVVVGSAGICDALARQFVPASSRCLLAVIGSMSEIAQQQITLVSQDPGVEAVFIDIEDMLNGSIADYVPQIVCILASGRHCLIHTCSDNEARHQIPQLCTRWQLERSQLGEKICHFLGQLTQQVLCKVTPGALYLSGGDVATAIASVLGATGFRITDRVAQCVPYGYFLGGGWQRPVMTKAGGFGDETTLRQVLNFIEEKMSE